MLELLLAAVVIVALPVRAWRRYQRGAPRAPAGRYIAETVILSVALAGLLWRHQVPPRALGLRPDSFPRAVADVAICLTVVLGLDAWSVRRLTRRLHRAVTPGPPQGLAADALDNGQAAASFIAVACVGAIWEELCFRATVFLLMPHTAIGFVAGTVAGSALFGAQHLRHGLGGMAYSSGCGAMFSLLYLLTGDLPAVIVAHAAGNIMTALRWAPRLERARLEAQRRQAPLFLG